MPTNHIDAATLQAALIGYEIQRESIEGKIAEIRRQLGGRASGRTVTPVAQPPASRRKMSASARKRIAVAQKKRWAAYRKSKAK